MPFSPDLIESPHRLRVRTDNRILMIASGIAVFNFQGTSADPGGWRRDDIVITEWITSIFRSSGLSQRSPWQAFRTLARPLTPVGL